MSAQDNGPAEDTAREIFPATFFGDSLQGMTDFRPNPLPAEAPEPKEVIVPKVESAPVPVTSSELTVTPEEKAPASPAPVPAAKAAGPSRPVAPGKRTS